MKTPQSHSDPTQHQSAATSGEKLPQQSGHAVAAGPQHTLQGGIDHSPRVLTQRRAVQTAFGNALQRQPRALPNQTGMPDSLKAGIESLSGMDMSGVRVHHNSSQPAQLNALAYAQGNDIHLGPGQERHLPHEAWHVVQQRQGRVQATMQMAGSGVGVNDDVGLEMEADLMGDRAAAGSVQLMASAHDRDLKPDSSGPQGRAPVQRVRFLSVKRVAQGGSLYEGVNFAGPPLLAHNGGVTWWGPLASAQIYGGVAGGSVWRSTAVNALNLVDMSTPEKLGKTMRETIRRTNNNLSAPLQAMLLAHNFAYAVPRAVADTAQMCLDYGTAQYTHHNGQWTANPYVTQLDVDNVLLLAAAAVQVPALVGSVIQVFADHGSANALQLDDPNFLANPDAYVVLRKDATNLDLAFANALLDDLNQPGMAGEFHGLHVPAGMKFGGFTDAVHELLIRNSPANLTAPVAAQPGDPDLQVSDKTLGVDDSLLARAWRWFGLNN